MQFLKYIFFLYLIFFQSVTSKPLEFPNKTDDKLQSILLKEIKKNNVQKLIKQKNLAIALVDVTDINYPKLAIINGDKTIYSASLPKIGIMLAVIHEISLNKIKLTNKISKSLNDMIKSSSNTEATNLYNLVGPKRINEILQLPEYSFYNKSKGGGIWIGRPYAKGPTWKRDPVANASHAANVRQVARFYYMIESNQLISEKYSKIMKDILSDTSIDHKFKKGMKKSNNNIKMYRKSGTWRDYHSDSAIIERKDGKRYIAVAISHVKGGGQLLEKLIINLDNTITYYHR